MVDQLIQLRTNTEWIGSPRCPHAAIILVQEYHPQDAKGYITGAKWIIDKQNPLSGTFRRLRAFYKIGRYTGSVMVERGGIVEQKTDFLAVSLLAAVSVAVGLTSASYTDELTGAQSGGSGNLVSTIAGILGLDQAEVGDYLQGHQSEICYGTAVVRSE